MHLRFSSLRRLQTTPPLIFQSVTLALVSHFLDQVSVLPLPLTGPPLEKTQHYTRVCERAFQALGLKSRRSTDLMIKVSELGSRLSKLSGDTKAQKTFDHARLVLRADKLVKRYSTSVANQRDIETVRAEMVAFLENLAEVPKENIPNTLPNFEAILRHLDNHLRIPSVLSASRTRP